MNKIRERRLSSIIKAIAFFALLASFFANVSCEREEKAEFKSNLRTNGPPLITSVSIVPQNPNKDSELGVVIRSQDPEGDPVTYAYQWVKDEEEILEENKNILGSEHLRRGDMIQVKVTPSDGKAEGTPFLSPPVKILNSQPVIEEVWIEPKIAYASDRLRALVKGVDRDGDSINYTYQWTKNGALLAEENTDLLEKGRFKRGDTIAVMITPDDRENQGVSKKSQPITIVNSPPIIVSSPPTSIEGSDYVYQVKAHDPDNDPVSFAIKSAPKGMEIDKETGLIRWIIQWKDRGAHSIEIETSDPDGGKSSQRFVLNVEVR